MPLFGAKRSRISRAAGLGGPLSFWGRAALALRDRATVARLALCLAYLFAVLIAVEAWKVPFPYRLGDHPPHGIVAKVQFRREDARETERTRSLAESAVPYRFQHDPTVLESLPILLREDLEQVAAASTFDKLSDATKAYFGLTGVNRSTHTAVAPPTDPQEAFLRLRKVVTTANEGTADTEKITTLVHQFEQWMAPLKQKGVITRAVLQDHQIEAVDQLAVTPIDAPPDATPILCTPREIGLAEQMQDDGRLGGVPRFSPELASVSPLVKHWLLIRSPVTLKFDAAGTQQARREARRNVRPVYNEFEAGTILVEPGQRIEQPQLDLLREEYDQAELKHVSAAERIARMATVFGMLIVLAVLNGYYLVRNVPELTRSAGRLSIYFLAVVAALVLGRWMSGDPWRAEAVPLVATVMIFAIAYDQVFATITAFTLSLVLTVSTVGDLGQFIILMSISTTAVIPLSQVPSRSALIKVGFWTAATFFFVSWGVGIIKTQAIHDVWSDNTLLLSSLRGAGWCLAAGYFVAGSLPFIESMFGVVTDISLLELSDVSHPLLQQLVQRAPGTYNHSITVAAIGESAADRIGANGLLVRVGAYFHDVGKMIKPHYFIENMGDGTGSRHEHLAPAMSTLIIIGHVKDGVDLARQHSLPDRLISFIEQHHGTTLVEYFYHEASKQADLQPDHKNDAQESSFRYPGPKPQSRETAVLMLADAVEGASRTLSEPTPKRIATLVHDIAMKRLLDGQFDECSLTLSELRMIEDSLTKSLIGIYHGRIKYPEQRTA